MIKTGIAPFEILLPNVEDKTAWACIACDQFTSEKDYWNTLKEFVGGKYSALNLVLPEIYLSDNPDEKIKNINRNINDYLKKDLFTKLPKGFILTVRSTPFVKRRIGLIGTIDLDEYEYTPMTDALIRATEGTIEERIPPRLKIREKAKIEFPHVMILYDDEKREIAEPLYENRANLEKLYSFDLNMGGGKIEGYFIKDYKSVLRKFENLLTPERLIKKYGKEDRFLFAVGDGNHSLATAKAHWNKIKPTLTQSERENHPARFALVEFNNIYDEGIYFEPIYRFVKGAGKDFEEGLKSLKGNFGIQFNGVGEKVDCGKGVPESIKVIDGYIKDYLHKNGGNVDYIHGESNLKALLDANENSVGITFNKIDKSELFKYVSKCGPFPRKTFSMGEGIEKRYYFEGKMIVEGEL